MEKQTTINNVVSISGKGLHTGKQVTVTFRPAKANFGVQFQRVDIPDKPLVRAFVFNVYDTSRGTSVRENNAEVRTIEHLMAALAGLQIDNVLIEINAEETPILDGSSKLYVELLQQAGTKQLDANRECIKISEEIRFEKPDHE